MKYAAKKIAAMLLTMVIVSLLAFTAFSLISGDAAEIMLGTQVTPERLAALRAELGLDRPLPVRYLSWLLGFFTGDLGVSIKYNQPVWDLIAPKVLVTLCLSVLCFLLITAVSIPLGIRSAARAGGALDCLGTVANQLCMAVPSFFTGILLSWGFGITLKWFMPGSFPDLGTDFPGAVKYLFFAVLYRHVLKNALAPAVTLLAQTMAEIVAAGIVVEQVFVIPGLGRMLVASIGSRDYPVVQAIVVILAFWVVLAGTAADIINQRIDPRLRLGGDP